MWLFFATQYNSSLSSFVPNLKIISQVVAEKSLTENNVYMYYVRATEGKNEKLKKEGKLRISKTLAPIGAEKSVKEIFILAKEK